ncbi:MAG TPA: nucleotide exchange factor GrpE [Ferruginibacter sp.]|mgnify:FL=1|nr:nucleotide exchange factor GrpE [Ferruginibacter sp.]HRO06194.1 nucleotide exchange factor GrpE [Ferruginibacter sp.]HRO96587.1 nucleotide exchange factor GrpE [Ferruginibacter sp.]HRP49753.1 nucleotide exchange factor GrpE [Ferruginibacter sp.]
MEEKNTTTQETPEMNINADADIPGNSHLTNEDAGSADPAALAEQLEELKDKYLRLVAEFENYKRRTAKEKVEIIQTGGKDVMLPLLDVLDDLDRAEAQKEQSSDLEKIIEGHYLIFHKFRNALQQRGLKAMQVRNTPFDADMHEAITEMEAGEKMKGMVVDEVEKGYTLNDRIIRFAKVVVGK